MAGRRWVRGRARACARANGDGVTLGARTPRCRALISISRRVSACWCSGRPGRASRRSWAAWRACWVAPRRARPPARSPSTASLRPRRGAAWASSCRTPRPRWSWPAWVTTWPSAWRTWGFPARRYGLAWRSPSARWAWTRPLIIRRRSCRAGRSSAWRSRRFSRWARACCSWTSQPRTWIRAASPRCVPPSRPSSNARARRWWSSSIAWTCGRPSWTASSWWPTVASPPTAP